MSDPTVCLFADCDRTVFTRKMCNWHYRHVQAGDIDLNASRPPLMAGGSWLVDAACRDVDPELFHPLTEDPDSPQVKRARAVCSGCSVVRPCLAWALENQPDGIAGGLTSQERRRIRATAISAAVPQEASAR